MRDLVIFGATELAGMARYYAIEEHGRQVAAFVVDVGYRTYEQFHGDCFIALGYRAMRLRRAVYERVKDAGYPCINLVSPSGYTANSAQMEGNNLVLPGVIIEPGVQLGANNIIWSNATICHDSVIGSHNFIAANVTLGGHVRVGDTNFIGFSATVLQNVAIGDEVLIGAQTLVRRPTRDLHQYWGVPAVDCGAIDGAQGVRVE
jgi:sugar O-acyltransferase (sialic acid O-acetyltransferase NeuD family)